MGRSVYKNPYTGEEIIVDDSFYSGDGVAGTSGGYYHDDWFRTHVPSQVEHAIMYMLKHGWSDTEAERTKLLESIRDSDNASTADIHEGQELTDTIYDAKKFLRKNGVDFEKLNMYYDSGGTYENNDTTLLPRLEEESLSGDPIDASFNAYYNDLYSLKPGTLGREMLDNFTLAEQNAAISNMELAEAQYQSAAMQQAETVKAITDSVKAERMARLRAGMSESQIANQDMQTMLTNMNTLNQNMDILNQNRYAAQQQYQLAQDTAYQQYIQSITGLGGTSAAMAASDAGDAYMQALRRQQKTGGSFATNLSKVVNPNSN